MRAAFYLSLKRVEVVVHILTVKGIIKKSLHALLILHRIKLTLTMTFSRHSITAQRHTAEYNS